MRQVDKFCEMLDKLYESEAVNKARLIDIFHKANPNSLDEFYEQTKLPDLTTRTTYKVTLKTNQKW